MIRRSALALLTLLTACDLSTGGDAYVLRPIVIGSHSNANEPGWLLGGRAHESYVVRPDAEQGGALVLEPVADTQGLYGTWMRQVDATPYRGRRVRIYGATRTEGATQRVDFWVRAMDEDSAPDGGGIGGQWQRLPADSEWAGHILVLDVPSDAVWLEYGVGLAGPGRVWLDGATLDVVRD